MHPLEPKLNDVTEINLIKLDQNLSTVKKCHSCKVVGRPLHSGWCGFPPSSRFGGAALVDVAFPLLFGVVLFSLPLLWREEGRGSFHPSPPFEWCCWSHPLFGWCCLPLAAVLLCVKKIFKKKKKHLLFHV